MPYLDPPTFYAPLPLYSKKLSLQWDDFRHDFETIAPIIRGTVFDENVAKYLDSVVAGYEYGEDGFHNHFRTFYDKNTNNWLVQFNTATEASPVWVNYLTVNSVGTVTFAGSFYTATLDVRASGDAGDVQPIVTQVRHLKFHSDGFYITQDSLSQPIVNLKTGTGTGDITNAANLSAEGIFASKSGGTLQFKGLVAGTGITLTPGVSSITIDSTATGGGGGFYGIGVVQSDDKQGYSGINVLSFEAANFYLTRNVTDRDKVQINLRPAAGVSGGGTITGGASLGGTEAVFANNAAPTINFKGLTAGTGISLGSDANSVTITNTGPTLSQIGPGFYGITAVQSDGLRGYKGLNVLSFETSSFYLTRSATDTDKVQINLRPVVSNGGTITGGTALGGTTDTFAGLSGPNLTFRGISAGTGISVSQNASAITVVNTGPTLSDIGPGFYGITAIQSDGLRGYNGLNVLSFEAANFYLTRSTTDTDKVQINLRPAAGVSGGGTITGGASLGGTEPIFASNAAPTINFKGLTAGTGISLGSDANAVTITNTGPTLANIGPGFYGITAVQSDGFRGYKGLNVLSFEAANFYLTRSATDTDKVQINLRPAAGVQGGGTITGGASLGGTEPIYGTTTAPTINIKGLTAGTGISLGSDANSVTITNTGPTLANIGPGFYGIGVVQSDNKQGYSGINVLSFEASSFYIERNTTDPDKVQINLRPPAGSGTGTITGGTSLGGTEPIFGTNTAPTINFKGLTAGTGISLGSDASSVTITNTGPTLSQIGPGFYGIGVAQSDNKQGYSGINILSFEATNFYITRNTTDRDKVQINFRPAAPDVDTVTGATALGGDQAVYAGLVGANLTFKGITAGIGISLGADANAVTITNTGPTLSQIGPGFYGIGVVQSDNKQGYSGINVLSFEASSFYIERNATDPDKVQIGLRPPAAGGTGTITGGTSLGGTEPIYGTTTAPTINFKGLTAGTGISLGSDANAVTITNTGPTLSQIGPGFYGIGVVQSDNKQGYSGINVLSFEASSFYIERNTTDPDKVQINLRPTAGSGTGTITGGTALGGTEAVFAGTVVPNLTFKGITAGTGISLSSDANAITINSTATGGGGGFYGIDVVQSDNLRGYSGINVLSFAASNFYISRNATDPDKVQIGIRGAVGTVNGGAGQTFTSSSEWVLSHNLNAQSLIWATYNNAGQAFIPQRVDTSDPNTAYFYLTPASAGRAVVMSSGGAPSAGTITGGTSLGGTEPVYGTTTAPTINFKGLTAGTGITLSSDANAITINSTATGGGGGGFYGITVGQSDDKAIFKNINVVKFLSSDFYVDTKAANPDEVMINLRPPTHSVVESINFQFDYPVVEHYFLDSYSMFEYTVDSVNLVTQSGQAGVGFYIRRALEGYEREPGVSITGLDPVNVTPNRWRDSQFATGNNAVPVGRELIMSIFYLNQNPKSIRGAIKIRRTIA